MNSFTTFFKKHFAGMILLTLVLGLLTNYLYDEGKARGFWRPDSTVRTPFSDPPQEVRPYKSEQCEALSRNYGDWRPTSEELTTVGELVAPELCYGYWETDPRRFARTIRLCADEVRQSTISFHVIHGEGHECWLEFRSASWQARKWIWIRSFYARGAQFGDQVDIIELTGDRLERYASQWQCPLSLREAWEGTVLPSGNGAPSDKMRSEWTFLPGLLRGFLCTSQFVGEDLSAPRPDE